MPNLRGRNEKDDRKAEAYFSPSEEVRVHGSAKEAETGSRGSHRNRKPMPEQTEKGGDKARKTETQMWAFVVEVLERKRTNRRELSQ